MLNIRGMSREREVPAQREVGDEALSHQILVRPPPVFDEMTTLFYLTSAYLVVVFNEAQIFFVSTHRDVEKYFKLVSTSSKTSF